MSAGSSGSAASGLPVPPDSPPTPPDPPSPATRARAAFLVTLATGVAWFFIELVSLGIGDPTTPRTELLRRALNLFPWQLALFGALAVGNAVLAALLRFNARASVWSALALASFFFLGSRVVEGLLRVHEPVEAVIGIVATAAAIALAIGALAGAERAVPPRFARGFRGGAWVAWSVFFVIYMERSGSAIGMWKQGAAVLVDAVSPLDGAIALVLGAVAAATGGRWTVLAAGAALAFAVAPALHPSPEGRPPGGHPGASGSADVGSHRPDVILFLVDTFRYDHLGANVGGGTLTPQIDALAEESVRFARGYSPGNITKFAMPGIHTSLPYRVTNRTIPPGVTTLAEHLKSLGYRTVGISTNPNVSSQFGYDQGFDVFVDSLDTRDFLVVNLLQILGAKLPGPSYAAGIVTSALYYPPISDLHREALRLLDEGEGPTFLYVHTMDPHGPYLPPRGFLEDGYRSRDFYSYYDFLRLSLKQRLATDEFRPHLENLKQRYAGEVRFTDKELGDLIRDLRSRAGWSDTLVWLLSDHGEAFGENDYAGHGEENMSNTMLRVPFLLKPPASAGIAPQVVEGPVSSLDLLPTTLAMLGAEPSDPVFGSDLTGILRGGEADPERVVVSYTYYRKHDLYSLISGNWKLVIRMPSDGDIEETHLYDLAEDPGETTDVSAQYGPVVEQLLAAFHEWRSREDRAAYGGADTEVDATMQEQLRRLGYVE